MKQLNIYSLLFIAIIASSCAATHPAIDKKQFRHSKTIATYSGMGNEFEDGYLELKENGYFKFYLKLWMIVSIKEGAYTGRYSQEKNTIHLNWLDANPKNIKPYLSSTCEVDSIGKKLSFVDDATGATLWSMGKH